MGIVDELPDRFASKFDVAESGCWEWNACIAGKGYGYFYFEGTNRRAHRWIYELLRGPIGKGLHIDHLCRNRRCVNPDHLEAVTPKENQARGNARAGMRRKTHCPKGHEYDEENTYKHPHGHQVCRRCRRAHHKKYSASHKEQIRQKDRAYWRRTSNASR